MKVAKLLSDQSKVRRRRLTEVNIKVTFIVWLTEFLGSLVLLLSTLVFGHDQVGTAVGRTISLVFYFVLLPFLYLVNDSDVKSAIVEDSWVHAIRGIFNRTNIQLLAK